MKYGILFIGLLMVSTDFCLGAEQSAQQNNQITFESEVIKLPKKNTPKYWDVRSEAISEFLPLLTQKRREVKSFEQVFRNYLLDTGMASDFTASNTPVPNDPNVFFAILRVGQGLEDMNIPKPKKRPSWEDLMHVVMQHVVFEGYLPTHVEEGEDLEHFVKICKQKEQYGQKVRKDLRSCLDQCARMWVYLESNGKLDDFKAYFADLLSQQKAQKAQAKAQYTQAHQEQMISQAQRRQERQFEDREAQASFNASRQQQRFEGRQNRLNSRAANAGINIYGF